MIGDRHVLVVGQQRVFWTEQPSHIRRMIDRCVEVGISANRGRQLELRLIERYQQARVSGPAIQPENPTHSRSQFGRRRPSERHQIVEP